ncbi:hypothetical protein [Burkholderia sp. TSV86]|uniref:hypothetical protein n=1 Tax=Burkholderia sp. TSV86 TaxID=1385594 RepID=UPI000757D59E|nr:hypothetical protein [Burkholderia sp. TSV86]KVE32709.1 hypothetical protein WS68_16455 [Burkholderia sp. TSV86]
MVISIFREGISIDFEYERCEQALRFVAGSIAEERADLKLAGNIVQTQGKTRLTPPCRLDRCSPFNHPFFDE